MRKIATMKNHVGIINKVYGPLPERNPLSGWRNGPPKAGTPLYLLALCNTEDETIPDMFWTDIIPSEGYAGTRPEIVSAAWTLDSHMAALFSNPADVVRAYSIRSPAREYQVRDNYTLKIMCVKVE